MGERTLKSHAKTEKHKRLVDLGIKIKVSELLMPTNRTAVPSTQSSNRVENSSKSAVNGSALASQPTENCEPGNSASAASSTITSYTVGSDTLSAKILWALKVCNSHQSHSLVTGSGELFRKMFPDSKIAAEFSMAETKCTYITKFGLAPYFTIMLVSRVKASGPFVVMFDESLSRSTQTKQIHIRFCDSGKQS